jgi:diguanylate cyclase (GGDEF)-like protein
MDEVTHVFNRKFLIAHLNKILPLAERRGEKVGLLLVSVDHFKAVIEEFNYDIGDKVLIELSEVLKSSIRESDVIAMQDSENFIVVLPNIKNSEDIDIVAKKCIDNFAKVKVEVMNNQYLQKTVSIGGLVYSDDAVNIDEIFKNLDIALVEARNKGRGQMCKFSEVDLGICDFF